MVQAETTTTRAPRGTKPVSHAFFEALDAVPEATRSAVAKAAQAMIRDELETRRDKVKAIAAKEKARQAAPAKRSVKAPARQVESATPVPQPKRRSRKPADASAVG